MGNCMISDHSFIEDFSRVFMCIYVLFNGCELTVPPLLLLLKTVWIAVLPILEARSLLNHPVRSEASFGSSYEITYAASLPP